MCYNKLYYFFYISPLSSTPPPPPPHQLTRAANSCFDDLSAIDICKFSKLRFTTEYLSLAHPDELISSRNMPQATIDCKESYPAFIIKVLPSESNTTEARLSFAFASIIQAQTGTKRRRSRINFIAAADISSFRIRLRSDRHEIRTQLYSFLVFIRSRDRQQKQDGDWTWLISRNEYQLWRSFICISKTGLVHFWNNVYDTIFLQTE